MPAKTFLLTAVRSWSQRYIGPPSTLSFHYNPHPAACPPLPSPPCLLQLRALSLHRLDPHAFYRQTMRDSFTTLGHLTQLEELELAHSHTLELPPGLSRLSNLTYLSLRNTHWRQGDLGAVLAPLTRLRALDLSYQDLPSLPAPAAALGGLRALAMAGGQFPLHEAPYCQGVSLGFAPGAGC